MNANKKDADIHPAKDVANATQLLQEAEQQKMKICAAKIYAMLKENDYGLVPEMLFRGTKLLPKVLLVSRSGMAYPLQPPFQTNQLLEEK